MKSIPDHLYFTKTHEWIYFESNRTMTMGITEHAQSLLGDIVYVELPEVGQSFTAGQPCGVVESVKAAADLYAPIDCEVMGVNERLIDRPELMNEDPYQLGFIGRFRIKNTDTPITSDLMTAEQYEASLKTELG